MTAANRVGLCESEMPFCSVIIPTVGRASLARAVNSVLAQEAPAGGLEVIVVNDAGFPLAAANWQQSPLVRSLTTQKRDKSVARNAGAAVACGRYLYFLDDDDWLFPGAVRALAQLARFSEAILVYGDARLTDRQGRPLLDLRHQLAGNCFIQLMAGEWIPVGAYMVRADAFFAVGGFNPSMSAGEDSDLCRRLALRGPFQGANALVVNAAVGAGDSTTDYGTLARQSRRAREAIIDEQHAFSRMLASANNGYWRGRVVRIYLTSVIWNLKQRRPLAAAGRALYALLALTLALRWLPAPAFWMALSRPHQSFAFRHSRQARAQDGA